MNLSLSYLGFDLPHPFVAGASPLVDDLDAVRRLEDAGAAAIVMHSLFEEQLVTEQLAAEQAFGPPSESFAEALSYLPEPSSFVLGPDSYLEQLSTIKQSVSVPVIASLNGTSPGGWLEYARLLQQAGADALELNVYQLVTDPLVSAEDVERETVDMVAAVKEAVSIPLAVKLSPYYTSLAHFARRLADAGADALVLFNRFYQPDIDPVEQEAARTLELSTPSELRLRLHWLSLLYGRVDTQLAVTGGVHAGVDAVKAVMCGASAVQVVSALLRHGPERLAVMRGELADWLEENEYDSLAEMHGSMSLLRCPDPHAFERVNYVKLLQSWLPVT